MNYVLMLLLCLHLIPLGGIKHKKKSNSDSAHYLEHFSMLQNYNISTFLFPFSVSRDMKLNPQQAPLYVSIIIQARPSPLCAQSRFLVLLLSCSLLFCVFTLASEGWSGLQGSILPQNNFVFTNTSFFYFVL